MMDIAQKGKKYWFARYKGYDYIAITRNNEGLWSNSDLKEADSSKITLNKGESTYYKSPFIVIKWHFLTLEL